MEPHRQAFLSNSDPNYLYWCNRMYPSQWQQPAAFHSSNPVRQRRGFAGRPLALPLTTANNERGEQLLHLQSTSSPSTKRPRIDESQGESNEDLRKQLSCLENKLSQSKKECAEMLRKQADAEKRESELKIQIAVVRLRNTKLQSAHSECRSNMEKTKNENEVLQERLDKAELKDQLRAELEKTLEKQKAELGRKISELQEALKGKVECINELEIQNSLQNGKSENLEAKLEEKIEELNENKTTTETLRQKLQEMVAKSETLRGQIQSLTAFVEEKLKFLVTELEPLEIENSRLKPDVHYYKTTLKDLESKLEKWEQISNEIEIQFLHHLMEKDEKLVKSKKELAQAQERLDKISVVLCRYD